MDADSLLSPFKKPIAKTTTITTTSKLNLA